MYMYLLIVNKHVNFFFYHLEGCLLHICASANCKLKRYTFTTSASQNMATNAKH